MKSLKEYLEECGEGFATPMNTPGMGNPMGPTTEVGSEPLTSTCKLKKKKKKNENNNKFHIRKTKT